MTKPERPTLRIALGQMRSADTHADNIATMQAFAAEAAEQGADLLALPEVAGLMNRNPETAKRQVTEADRDPYLAACAEAAAANGLWLHAGSTPVLGPDGRFLNHSAVFGPDGALRASYDKIHLFDVALEGRAPIGESKRFAPGRRAVILPTPWGDWGLTICYDLRFPHLFRHYAQRGVTMIFVPSAFTVPTGRAHWEVLLRARAIETGAFIVAAAQSGHHADGRETWGHSMIVDPWGQVVCDMGRADPSVDVVEIDLGAVAAARRQIPAWGRDQPFDSAP